MKHSEAIDMILDGGEAYREEERDSSRYTFCGDSLSMTYGNGRDASAPCFNKEDFTKTDWIVEKDGVVYEEYPGMVISREMIVDAWKRNIPDGFVKVTLYSPPVELRKIPMTESGYKKLDALLESGDLLIDERGTPLERVREVKILKSRTNKQDEPAELEEGGEHWMSTEEIREALEAQFPPKPIIADEVNENWLEKKMLCFMNKHLYIHSGMNLDIKQGQCSNRACPFCFPQAKPKEDLIKKTIRDMQPVPTAKEASEKAVKNVLEEANKILEQPREKVTVEALKELILFFGMATHESMEFQLKYPHLSSSGEIMDDYKNKRCTSILCEIMAKIEYLVSLQEK